jgi:hypothetical protein
VPVADLLPTTPEVHGLVVTWQRGERLFAELLKSEDRAVFS